MILCSPQSKSKIENPQSKIQMSDRRYSKALRRVLLQTLVATTSMVIGLFFLRWWGWPVATALASTNFVLFAMPHTPPARPRSAFGGIGLHTYPALATPELA